MEASTSTGYGQEASAASPSVQAKHPRSPTGGDPKDDPRTRKRNRTVQSCMPCHRQKRKCDRQRPCHRCVVNGMQGQCVFEADEREAAFILPGDSFAELQRLRHRVVELEEVTRDLKKKLRWHRPQEDAQNGHVDGDGRGDAQQFWDVVMHSRQSPATAPVIDPDLEASSSRLRPYEPAVERLIAYEGSRNCFQTDPESEPVFVGNSSASSLLRSMSVLGLPHAAFPGVVRNPGDATEWIFSMPGYTWETDLAWIMETMPDQPTSARLLDVFVNEVDCDIHAWHTPSITSSYHDFFLMAPEERKKLPPPRLALIGAIVTVATAAQQDSASGDVAQGRDGDLLEPAQQSGARRLAQTQQYLAMTFHLLKLGAYTSQPALENVQAQLVLIHLFGILGKTADMWTMLGGVIKQAQILGLHVDPSRLDPDIPSVDGEVRRRIWWTIMWFDASLAMAFGWPPAVTSSECDAPRDIADDHVSGNDMTSDGGTTSLMTYQVAICHATTAIREILDRLYHQGTAHRSSRAADYDQVSRLGKSLRSWYNDLPTAIRYEPKPIARAARYDIPPLRAGPPSLASRPKLWTKQALALSIIYGHIMLVLNRPFIRQDPAEQAREASFPEAEVQCVLAAHRILDSHRIMLTLFPARITSWFEWFACFHAGVAMGCVASCNAQERPPALDMLEAAATLFASAAPRDPAAQGPQTASAEALAKILEVAKESTYWQLDDDRVTKARQAREQESQASVIMVAADIGSGWNPGSPTPPPPVER